MIDPKTIIFFQTTLQSSLPYIVKAHLRLDCTKEAHFKQALMRQSTQNAAFNRASSFQYMYATAACGTEASHVRKEKTNNFINPTEHA